MHFQNPSFEVSAPFSCFKKRIELKSYSMFVEKRHGVVKRSIRRADDRSSNNAPRLYVTFHSSVVYIVFHVLVRVAPSSEWRSSHFVTYIIYGMIETVARVTTVIDSDHEHAGGKSNTHAIFFYCQIMRAFYLISFFLFVSGIQQ